MQIILFVFLAYLLYRFVAGFVLPVATAAKHMKKQFREMQGGPAAGDHANNDRPEPDFNLSGKNRTTSGKTAPQDDYIEFEEVPPSKNY